MPIDLMLLPLEGCQVVLGAQWLSSSDDMIFNFKKLQLQFQYQGSSILWQGIQPPDNKVLTSKKIA